MSDAEMNIEDRLIKVRIRQTSDGSELLEPYALQDLLRAYAYDIEDSLLDTGAKKGDYTLLDLYSLAQPFALAEWKKENIQLCRIVEGGC